MTAASYVLSLVGAALVVAFVFELLRRRHLREKYAVLYLVLASGVATLALLPELLGTLSRLAGIEVPANLLFFTALIVLLLVSMQLAYESGRLEDETRVLAEEVALLRMDLDELRARLRDSPSL